MEGILPILVCAFVFIVALLKFLLKNHQTSQKINLPPCPMKLPIIGNLHQLGKLPPLSLRKLAQDLGPIIFLQLGEIPTIVVSSATMAKEVMKTHDLAFCSRPQLYSAKWLFYNCTNIVFSPYGAYWRHVRKICILELLSTKRVQSYKFIREEEVSRLVHRIEGYSSQEINLTKLLGLYANDVLSRVVLKRNFSEGGEYHLHGFQSMLDEYQELLGGFSLGDFFPSKEFIHTLTGHKARLKKTFKRFDSFFDGVIQEHLNSQTKGEKDLLDVLLDIQKEDSSEMPLTMDNVKAILLDMFAAGTDTSFITLDWGMTEMIKNPEVMKKAQAEVRSVVGERKSVLESDLPKLCYLKAVIKEIFRLHPPVPVLVPRESIKDVSIGGYDIPAKTRVFINVWAIGRDPESWKDPETFNPDRFLGSAIDFKGQDFELLPFGAGRRGCPGITFGTVTVELALAQLLHSFNWELPPGIEAKDLDLSEAFGISMHKTSDLIVLAKPQFS
ncbi:Cytochrome P450 71A1 [Bienertia sinuspersici]